MVRIQGFANYLLFPLDFPLPSSGACSNKSFFFKKTASWSKVAKK